jgi:hypothetical protein
MTTPKPPPDTPEVIDPLATGPDAPASKEEIAAAAELREALADPSRLNEDAEVARAIALAHAPRDLSPQEHEAILKRALASAPAKGRGRVLRVTFVAAASAFAVAAAAVLLLSPAADQDGTSAVALPIACVRSTQPLFREPFARRGGESERVDRIALARAGDFRDNRFTLWGVR